MYSADLTGYWLRSFESFSYKSSFRLPFIPSVKSSDLGKPKFTEEVCSFLSLRLTIFSIPIPFEGIVWNYHLTSK